MAAIIGLDVATTTGAVILDGDSLVHWEAFRPKGVDDPEIFYGYRRWLWAILVSHNIQHGAVEQPLVTNIEVKETKHDLSGTHVVSRKPVNMRTYLRLYGLFAHTLEVFYALHIPLEVVHQATWRKSFLGTGKGDKMMALAQCKRLGWEIKSKDAAEAAGVAFHLAGFLSPLGVAMRAGKK